MLNSIIEFSIKHKLIIGLLVLALIGYGSYQANKLSLDAVPDITDNQVQIITTTSFLSAPDVERLITFPIEQAVSNIAGIKKMRSFSRFGLSLITIVFEDDVDVYWARQQVSERLQIVQQQIPKGIGLPALAPITTGLGEVYQYVIRAKPGYEAQYDITELRTIQDWIVRRQLLGVKGVADVSSFGGKLKQYEIAVDVNKLNAYQLTINDLLNAVEKNNENTGGAYLEKHATVLYIRSEGLIQNIEELKNIVVKTTTDGVPLFIKDVADVRIGSAIRYGAMTYNDQSEVAGAVVMMLKGENSRAVVNRVKERISQIQKTLPEGVIIEVFLDRTKMVDNAISTVFTNLLEGALIVVLILILFLGNITAGLIVASVIPLSMLIAVILMNMFGVSGNLMSLGALDFGLLVDGAVIIIEACMSQFHLSKSRQMPQYEIDQLIYTVSARMRNTAVFGEIIILVVYLPIFTLEGIEGKTFMPMAQTVAFALFGAFILSLTYVPMMSALFLHKTVSDKKTISDRIMEYLENIHQKMLLKVLIVPKVVIALALGLFGISLYLFTRLGGEFIPELPEGDFAVETRVLRGSNLHTTQEACTKAAHILIKKFPEVEKIVGKIGSGEIPTDPMPMDAGDLMVVLKDKSQWTSAHTWHELAEKMSQALQDIPGVSYGFQYPVAMRFNELMTGAKQEVVCKIFGENLDTLSKYSKILGEIVSEVDGVENIYVEPIDGVPQVIIRYRRNEIAQFGLNVADINKVINTAFAGQSAGLLFENERRFDVVVRLANEKRKDVASIENLLIRTPNGSQIPLYQVANITIEESVNQIQREDAKRRIIVGFNVGDRDVESVVTDLKERVEKKLNLPSGYYITYGGAFENLEAAKKRLSIVVPVALLLILILLYFALGSLKQALLIYSAIPLSTIGGIFFLFIRDMPFSISAGVGFIALFGVAVLNGIVLIADFNRLKSEGLDDLRQIVLEGTKHRLRPVLMTASVASLGFLPMALSQGNAAEVQRPLATVVIGGLIVATFLTLFVLPILYIWVEKTNKKRFSKSHLHSTMNHITLIVVAVLFIACSDKSQQQETTESLSHQTIVKISQGQLDNTDIQVGEIKQQLISTTLKLNGKVDVPPQNMISISVPLGGYLKSTHLIEGMYVKKGELIAVMEDMQYIQLQQDYHTAKSRFMAIEAEYLRQQELNEHDASSVKAFQTAKADYLAQKVLINTLAEKLLLIGINPEKLDENSISRTINIYSPVNGFVSSVRQNIGKYVAPTDVLFELISLDDVHLVLTVFEKDLDKIFVGQKIIAYTNNYPDKKYEAVVVLIGRNLSPQRSVVVHCHFEHYDPKLIPGTYMNAEVQITENLAWVISDEAIVRFEGKQYIFTQLNSNEFEIQEVITGNSQNGLTQISFPTEIDVHRKLFVLKDAYHLLTILKNKEE